MTPDEMKFIAGNSSTGGVFLMRSAIEQDNAIWRHMMDLGWPSFVREADYPLHFKQLIEKEFLDGLHRAKDPDVAAQALRRFFEGVGREEVTQAITRCGDTASPLMRWTTAPVRSSRLDDFPQMMSTARRLVQEAVALGCDINVATPVTISSARNGKQRAEHTALSHLIVDGALIVSNPGADGPSSTGQKAEILENAATLVQCGARVGPREAAALTQMVAPTAAINWIVHLESLGACTPQDVISFSGRLKKDPEVFAAIQAIAAKSVMSEVAKLRRSPAA